MKKIILLFFVLILSPKTFGQNPTYTMTLSYQTQNLSGCTTNLCSGCEKFERLWKMGNYVLPYNETGFANVLAKYPYNNNLNITQINISIPENNYTVFYFTNYSEKCLMQSNQPVDCVKRQTLDAKSQGELYESAVAPLTVTNSCFGIVKVLSYKPNMTLNAPAKYQITYTNEELKNYILYGIPLPERGATVCSGELIELTTSPLGFKRGTYNWQYKIKGGTWKNFKYKNVNNTETTYVAKPTFTIADILNTEDENYTGFIDIRLGSGQNAPFTSVVKLYYSPCTVVIKDRKYVAPDCSGDPVKSIVAYFDRDLETNETLSPFQIIPYPKQTGDPIRFAQNAVTSLVYDPETKWYKYSFIIPENEKLENRNYTIEYQSQVNGVPRGTLISDEPFLYKEPDPLTFEIKKATNPLCTDETVEIAIEVKGGTENYKFYVDGILTTATKNQTDGFYYIKGLIPTAINNIKVMDKNNCIEK